MYMRSDRNDAVTRNRVRRNSADRPVYTYTNDSVRENSARAYAVGTWRN